MGFRSCVEEQHNVRLKEVISHVLLCPARILNTLSPLKRRILRQFTDRCSPDCHKMLNGENPAVTATYVVHGRTFFLPNVRDGTGMHDRSERERTQKRCGSWKRRRLESQKTFLSRQSKSQLVPERESRAQGRRQRRVQREKHN